MLTVSQYWNVLKYHRQVDFRYWFQSPRFFGSRIDSSLVKLNVVTSWTDFVFWFIRDGYYNVLEMGVCKAAVVVKLEICIFYIMLFTI